MEIRVKKVHPKAKLPRFARKGDVGMDLYSVQDLLLKPGQRASVRTGLVILLPEGLAALIWDKGGPSHKHGIKILGGVFESNYTGEYFVGLINLSDKDYIIKEGQKIAQVLFQKVEFPKVVEHKGRVPKTNRQDGAFGSTGMF